MNEGQKQLFWSDSLPYKPLFAVKTDGNAYCYAPTLINARDDFIFRCKMRMTGCESDCNLFGANNMSVGTYTWSSSTQFALNQVSTASSERLYISWQEFAELKELKFVKKLNASKTYFIPSVYISDQLLVEGLYNSELSYSNLPDARYLFGIFCEQNSTYSGDDPHCMRPTKCPQFLQIQSISLETDAGMQFDMRACLDKSNVPCFYDMVTKSYVYSKGTGSFIRVDA